MPVQYTLKMSYRCSFLRNTKRFMLDELGEKLKQHEIKTEKNYVRGFSYSENMANFEVFHQIISSGINLLFLKVKSVLIHIHHSFSIPKLYRYTKSSFNILDKYAYTQWTIHILRHQFLRSVEIKCIFSVISQYYFSKK